MAPQRKLKIELLYDYWDEAGDRIPAGKVISLPEKVAAEMINIGKARLVV